MQDKVLGFRDPHAALTDIIISQGYEYGGDDQPMIDVVVKLERDVALQVLEAIRVKLDEEGVLNPKELREFILKQGESVPSDDTPTIYLH